MVYLIVIALSAFLSAACIITHYELLRLTGLLIPRLTFVTRSKVLIVIGGVFLAHIVEICLFALGYWLMLPYPDLGAIRGDFNGSPLDLFYFSITSYTTLGVGDLLPHGALRFVSGIEALVGFVLVGWSASFTYLTMEQFWAQHGGHRKRGAADTRPPP